MDEEQLKAALHMDYPGYRETPRANIRFPQEFHRAVSLAGIHLPGLIRRAVKELIEREAPHALILIQSNKERKDLPRNSELRRLNYVAEMVGDHMVRKKQDAHLARLEAIRNDFTVEQRAKSSQRKKELARKRRGL
jgi:hypothetical protein